MRFFRKNLFLHFVGDLVYLEVRMPVNFEKKLVTLVVEGLFCSEPHYKHPGQLIS